MVADASQDFFVHSHGTCHNDHVRALQGFAAIVPVVDLIDLACNMWRRVSAKGQGGIGKRRLEVTMVVVHTTLKLGNVERDNGTTYLHIQPTRSARWQRECCQR
jgi:hypothetical protein